MIAVLGPAALAGFLVSALIAALVMKAGVLDMPNARSNHARPTPRAGGLGIAAGLGAGLTLAASTPLAGPELAGLLAVCAVFCAAGFADDLFTLDEWAKFAVFVAACLALAVIAGPVTRLGLTLEFGAELPFWAGLAGSALFAFVVINAVNFMDGSDAMMAAVMIPASLALCVAGLVAGVAATYLIAAVLAAALAGFLPFNTPRARLFAGDAGALLTGAAYAAGALAMAGHGFSGSLWLAPMFVLVFLADVLLTLLRRARHGRFSLSAHREHAYQRLIAAGWSHGSVALAYGGLTAIIALSGLVAAQGPDGAVPAAFAIWVVVLAVLYRAVGRIAPEAR
ncbi:MAG: hypothetical protein ABL308_00350 [Oceanicaulis sp.]